MGKTIKSGAREVIFNVFKRCLAKYHTGKLLTELDDLYKRVADMTGKSESTVRRIINEGNKNEGKFTTPAKHRKGRTKIELDDFKLCAIRQKIQFSYTVLKIAPTLRKLLAVAKEELEYKGGREKLRQILHAIGFSYKKCSTNRESLIEKPNIVAKRENFLEIIKRNGDLPVELQKQIVYLDESYIHTSYKLRKCWQSIKVKGIKHDISKGKRWIIVYAGTANEFVPNALLIFSGTNKMEDYHSEMNSHNFTKWVTEKLIPNLNEASIIVMDNAPYHSVVQNKAPTSAARVDEIKLWLLENNITFEPSTRKPALLMLVKKHKPEPVYQIDELLGEHGHEVVRLPPYHCDLNPIELIWGIAKQKVAAFNVGGAIDKKNATEEAFNSIGPETWNNCVEHIKKIEHDYYERGMFFPFHSNHVLYEDIDRLVIRVGEDSSDSSSDSEDDQELGSDMSGVENLDSD